LPTTSAGDPFTSSCVTAQRPSVEFRRILGTTRLKPSHSEQAKACFEIEVLDIEERSLLSFQRPVPCLKDGVKKTSDSRQEASEDANRSLYESGLEAPMVELQGFPAHVRSDGP
jgi:hypothetical protein